jgi:hypothetical protein
MKAVMAAVVCMLQAKIVEYAVPRRGIAGFWRPPHARAMYVYIRVKSLGEKLWRHNPLD